MQAPGNWLNFNRYAYCYGNPFKYTDPDGEWIQYVVGAVVGGTINLISNWHDGVTFWEGFSYFGVGALSGVFSVAAPHLAVSIAAGASALNNLTQQSFQPDGSVSFTNVNWGQVGFSGIMGATTSIVGGEFGKALGAEKWFAGINSPLLQNVLRNVSTNTVVGGTLGGIFTSADGGSFFEGFACGAKMGLVTGTLSGIGGAVVYSKENNVNLLTGKENTVKEAAKEGACRSKSARNSW